MVEHNLAKVGVAGSSPVFRSRAEGRSSLEMEAQRIRVAQMAELVDALVSGTSNCEVVQVRVLYTRYFEGVVAARPCEFESHSAHEERV